jgi:hypothetical protein
MNSQSAFAAGLLNPELPCPSGLKAWNGSDPAVRFAVYRNNVTVSLVDSLAATYPVLQALVGEEFFRAMARVFVQANPPRSRIMAFYGLGLADFVGAFPPAATVPYLGDMARLEMARVQAYHAADSLPLEPESLQAALADPETLMSLQLVLHPSVQVIESPFAIFSLWAAHQGVGSLASVDPEVAQTVLVYRQGLEVNTLELAVGVGQFIGALNAGETLVDAADLASHDPAFDITHALALLLRLQLITHISDGDPHHDFTH